MSVKLKNVIIKLFAVIALTCAVLFFALTVSPFGASAATVNVNGDSVWNIFDWNTSTRWDADGPVAIRNNGTTIALKRTFDVSEGKEFKIRFQVPILDHETRAVLPNQSGVDGNLKVNFTNLNNGLTANVTYWLGGNTSVEQGATAFSIYDTRNWAEYYSNDWTMGVVTDGSYFTLGFNTTDYIKHEIAGGSYGKVTVAQDAFAEIFKDCECVQVVFEKGSLPEGTQFEVKLLEVNGQSLAQQDGVIDDTVAPIVPKLTEVNGTPNIELNTPYSIQCKQWFSDATAQNAIYTVQPAYDVISGVDLSYAAKITNISTQESYYSGTYNVNDKCLEGVKFTKAGKYNLQVEVTDRAGNKGLSTPVVVDFGSVVEYRVGQQVIKTETVGKGVESVTLLGADQVTLADGKVFVGWANLADGKLYKAGSQLPVTGDLSLTAMAIDLVTLSGARVYISTAKKGIVFESTIDYSELENLGSGYISKIGTIITPTRYVTDLGVEFTIAALQAKGAEVDQELYYDIEKGEEWLFGDGHTYCAAISMKDDLTANYSLQYSARAYVVINYADGSNGTVYGGYNVADNSRSMYQVALAAKKANEVGAALDYYIQSVGDLVVSENNIVGNESTVAEPAVFAEGQNTVVIDGEIGSVILNGVKLLNAGSEGNVEITVGESTYLVGAVSLSVDQGKTTVTFTATKK